MVGKSNDFAIKNWGYDIPSEDAALFFSFRVAAWKRFDICGNPTNISSWHSRMQ